MFALSWNVMKKFGAGFHRPCTRNTMAAPRAAAGAPRDDDDDHAAPHVGPSRAPVPAVDDPRSLRGPHKPRSGFARSQFVDNVPRTAGIEGPLP